MIKTLLVLLAAVGAFGLGAAYFGLHGWQLAIMPVSVILLGWAALK